MKITVSEPETFTTHILSSEFGIDLCFCLLYVCTIVYFECYFLSSVVSNASHDLLLALLEYSTGPQGAARKLYIPLMQASLIGTSNRLIAGSCHIPKRVVNRYRAYADQPYYIQAV
ncbi:uncharacterized protein BO66DRAFT_256738 [Aspergillus aculeatinus CBS 121060]|uniref:Uncharacterized protein n=1 Tax=Aspergillus aculeatinus CBS 121060 TaxID=1448322 RepID=A0ACD1GSA6_9EURO|nr:hypothetical protein BO66DRAFT_256738 [Aspergillus aculeatinus CBS 121060]RAH64002.1 hypothetical protein BO66DRAFT_256738 [Aspergillus aculeatinus CBS 121060]